MRPLDVQSIHGPGGPSHGSREIKAASRPLSPLCLCWCLVEAGLGVGVRVLGFPTWSLEEAPAGS